MNNKGQKKQQQHIFILYIIWKSSMKILICCLSNQNYLLVVVDSIFFTLFFRFNFCLLFILLSSLRTFFYRLQNIRKYFVCCYIFFLLHSTILWFDLAIVFVWCVPMTIKFSYYSIYERERALNCTHPI